MSHVAKKKEHSRATYGPEARVALILTGMVFLL